MTDIDLSKIEPETTIFTSGPVDIPEEDYEPEQPAQAAKHAAEATKRLPVDAEKVSDLDLKVWNLKRFNPRTPRDALARARQESLHPTKNLSGLCVKSTAIFYGWGGSGEYDAGTFWRAQEKHTTGTPPAGALVFWAVGRHDHVALSAGNGKVWSVDIIRIGKVNLVDIDDITVHWGARYEGWSLPYFPKAWGPIGPLVVIKAPKKVTPVSISKAMLYSRNGKPYAGLTTVALALRNDAHFHGFVLNGVWGSGKRATWRKWAKQNGIHNESGYIGEASLRKLAKLAGFPLIP